jgi:hypothetical protein
MAAHAVQYGPVSSGGTFLLPKDGVQRLLKYLKGVTEKNTQKQATREQIINRYKG